jgi:tetratricopeptide (TPR) repeat protein
MKKSRKSTEAAAKKVPPPDKAPANAESPQASVFEAAARAFQAGDFRKARSLYLEASTGSSAAMAHAARLYAKMCDDRNAKAADPELKSAEDHYNLAITLINQRSLAAAEQHLNKALNLAPEGGDHLYYALALCRGLQGDLEGAHKHLRRAIDLQPRNRFAARTDPDFFEIAHRPPLRDLIFS